MSADSGEIDEPQTAMLLTEQEWQDLALICSSFLVKTHGSTVDDVLRRRDLAIRIRGAVDLYGRSGGAE